MAVVAYFSGARGKTRIMLKPENFTRFCLIFNLTDSDFDTLLELLNSIVRWRLLISEFEKILKKAA